MSIAQIDEDTISVTFGLPTVNVVTSAQETIAITATLTPGYYESVSLVNAAIAAANDVNNGLASKADNNDVRLSDARTPLAHNHTESEITNLDKYSRSAVDSMVGAKEDSITKNTGFNKNFGNTAGTVTQGDDARLSDARTPTAHAHTKSQITDFSDADYATAAQGAKADSALQALPPNAIVEGDSRLTNARTPVVHTHTESQITDLDKYSQTEVDVLVGAKENSFSKNSAFNKDFGNTAGTVTQGNDVRLSDARTPVTHTHTKSQITDFSDNDYATAAQGAAADSALQALPANAIVEGDSRLTNARTPTAHTHIESDITDLDKYTQAQINALIDPLAIRDGAETLTGVKTFTDGIVVGGDVAITGNLTIAGVGTTSIGNEVSTGDNMIVLNADEVGTPSLNIGITGERGTDFNTILQWNETIDKWEAGLINNLQAIVLDNDPRLSDTRAPTTHSHTKSQITDFSEGDYATATQGAKADTALQSVPGNVVLTDDPRLSNPRTPTAHTHTKSQITDFSDGDYATAAQGAKADTALQSVPANYVQNNDARLSDARAPTLHTHTKSQITDFFEGDYATSSQGAKADTALQSVPANYVQTIDSRLSDARTPLVHTHTKSQITDFSEGDYATASQGAKADTALQSLPAHNHDADYATAAQGLLATTALQPATGDANYLKLSGGVITGNLSIDSDGAAIIIKGGSTHSQLRFDTGGFQAGFIYADATNDIFRIQKRISDGTAPNELQLHETHTLASKKIRVNPGQSTVLGDTPYTLTTKDYVDTFMPKSGGVATGNVEIHSTSPMFLANDTTGTSGSFRLYRDGSISSMYFDASTSSRIRKYAGDGTTIAAEMSFFESGVVTLNCEMRGVAGVQPSSLVTKAQMDAAIAAAIAAI